MSEVEKALSSPNIDMQALPALLQTVSPPLSPSLSPSYSLPSQAMEDPTFDPKFKVNGRGYLHFLAEAGAARVMKRLVQMGCSVREYDDEGVAPVHIAAAAGHLLCLKLVRFFFCWRIVFFSEQKNCSFWMKMLLLSTMLMMNLAPRLW